MDYAEALEYIHSVSWLGSKPGLSRVGELLARLGNPQDKLGVVHIAGTNGKGSTAAMLEQILRASGLKTGLYTSPYIVDFCERMRINGASIERGELAALIEKIRPLAQAMADSPTEFELITAAAFEYFYKSRCDIVVLEVGMGGRLDATNVVTRPLVSVITPISLDHTEYLGDTIEKIAAEKAGIIKPGRPVVSLQDDPAAVAVLKNAAAAAGARFTEVDPAAVVEGEYNETQQKFRYLKFDPDCEFSIRLLGRHQLFNAAAALEAAAALRAEGYDIPPAAVKTGLAKAIWPARFELAEREPVLLLDGAHNAAGACVAVAAFERHFPGRRAVVLFGVLADKPFGEMAALFNTIASGFVAFAPNNPRALGAAELAQYLGRFNKPVLKAANAAEALALARAMAKKDAVLAVGSLYAAGELLRALGRNYGQL